MGGIAIDIHIQRVYIGGPAFSINSQNADVWPEAHAPKCAVKGNVWVPIVSHSNA